MENYKRLIEMYQQNHGNNQCIQISSLAGLAGLSQKITAICSKNEKECVQKLKESSLNPLMHLKGNDSSSSASDRSEEGEDSDFQLHDDMVRQAIRANKSTSKMAVALMNDGQGGLGGVRASRSAAKDRSNPLT